MKKVLFLAFLPLLWACGDDESSSELSKDVQMLLDSKNSFSEDSVIYLADTVNFVDKISQYVDFGTEVNPEMNYVAKAFASAIDVRLQVYPGLGDGSIVVTCNPAQSERLVFNDPVFPATENGYKLSFKDSLKVGDSTYYDIVVFNATDSSYNLCNISAFYYGIHDGLVRVVSKNGVALNRVPANVYEEAEDRRAKEKAVADSIAQAVADSIAQAVADSIAQAVADSIIKANTVDSSGSDGDSIAIPQEVVDLAESVAECIKKAYSSGSLSAIKDCKI